ncbi:MAG: hypothetical protein HC817_12615 [Saprospiraceae bacterium]|nr:hypothetical protein [Saprospiraceae bacterium]
MGGVKTMLEDAKNKGATITNNPDGTLTIVSGNPSNSSLDLRGEEKVLTHSLVDPKANIVKSAILFDKKVKKMLSRMAFTYKNVGKSTELTHILVESKNPKSPNNRPQSMVTVTAFSNVNLKIKRKS